MKNKNLEEITKKIFDPDRIIKLKNKNYKIINCINIYINNNNNSNDKCNYNNLETNRNNQIDKGNNFIIIILLI